MKYRVGRSVYGITWHLLRDDGMPVCGYTSFNWSNGHRELKEVSKEEIKKLNLCSNCKRKLR